MKQALLIGSVATCVTLEVWVRRAGRVTLRRLEDEVSYWRHLKESRPAVWELLEGGPLPEGIVLAPGQPPRLHASALPAGSHEVPIVPGDVDDAGLHASAPGSASIGNAGAADSGAAPNVHASALDGSSMGGEAPAGAVASDRHSSASRPPTNFNSRSLAAISAESFLIALEQDEGTTPLPARMCVIKLLVEPEVREMWEATLAHLRSTVRANLLEWEALALVLRELWRVWDNKETRRQRRDNPTAERDGWRCTAPGCWSVGTGRLHEHHIVYKSRGGALTDPTNLTTLCSGHHLGLLHDGRMRCWGLAPDEVVWELGVEQGREPFLVYAGEVRIGGSAVRAGSDGRHEMDRRTHGVSLARDMNARLRQGGVVGF